MIACEKISFGGEQVVLTSERVVHLPEYNSIILADIHLGKSSFFRQNGLSVPSGVAEKDLLRLSKIINQFNPDIVIVAGDFFHATKNKELQLFFEWRKNYPSIDFLLVKGNHDKLKRVDYESVGISLINDYQIGNIKITHQPDEKVSDFHICGHVHPGIKMKLKGKQFIKLPCYILQHQYLILPAFSLFTGFDVSYSNEDSTIYGIAENEIIKI